MREIREGGSDHPAVVALLQEHLMDMHATSPLESCHALDASQFKAANIRFWGLWQAEQLLGCIALKVIEPGHGEIKSMRTAKSARGQGLAKQLIEHLLQQAQTLGLTKISLETGTADFFIPARCLYQRYGFSECAPFGDYVIDPHSTFMTRQLT
ncbi:GNAT family N-acetyltransferase [Celerinatantimonas yamalensis]|uniref:GNAT family N-acetyltransferase n=1 Tax=Celerinatantimonas yamalensis TaxID=559956 RepID=A0ABW9G273_9GAMM